MRASILAASTRPELETIMGNIMQVIPSVSRQIPLSLLCMSFTKSFHRVSYYLPGSPSPGESMISTSFSRADVISFERDLVSLPS